MADQSTLQGLPEGGRVLGTQAPMIPPVLSDGRVPTWKFAGRFNALQLPGGLTALTVASRVVVPSESRVGLILKNVGAGTVYISSEKEFAPVQAHTLGQNEVLTLLWPNAPMQDLYAIADAAHDLRVSEITFRQPMDWIATTEEDVEVGESPYLGV